MAISLKCAYAWGKGRERLQLLENPPMQGGMGVRVVFALLDNSGEGSRYSGYSGQEDRER